LRSRFFIFFAHFLIIESHSHPIHFFVHSFTKFYLVYFLYRKFILFN
jgi:hypothetical protein